MNFPTVLTIFRIILVAPLLICFFIDTLPAKIITLICFILAAATDFIDGRLARARNQVTDLGAFLDPLADKMLVNLTLLVLVYANYVPIWIFGIILIRDFAVDGIRMLAAKNRVTLAAVKLGKLKTLCQMFTIALILFNIIIQNHNLTIFCNFLLYLSVILTVISGVQIIIRGKQIITKPSR